MSADIYIRGTHRSQGQFVSASCVKIDEVRDNSSGLVQEQIVHAVRTVLSRANDVDCASAVAPPPATRVDARTRIAQALGFTN